MALSREITEFIVAIKGIKIVALTAASAKFRFILHLYLYFVNKILYNC